MIKIMRSFKINPGKEAQAIEYAIKTAKFMTGNSPDGALEVWQSLDGDIRQIHFVSTAESLASFDESMAFMDNNEGYAEIVKENVENGLLDVDSDRRHFFRKLG